MFKNPFSFDGRIRRTEYGLSFIAFVIGKVLSQIVALSISNDDGAANGLSFIFLIPLLIFLWAQGAKRCHDVGRSGWWQWIPLYPIYLMFGEGDLGENEYGMNPKQPKEEF